MAGGRYLWCNQPSGQKRKPDLYGTGAGLRPFRRDPAGGSLPPGKTAEDVYKRQILGGILIQKYPRYFDIVTNVANSRKVKGAKENYIAVSKLGENAGVIGAGEIVADNFFNEKVNELFCKNA